MDYRAKTIDTMCWSKINVSNLSDNQSTISMPNFIVNGKLGANKDWIFVLSKVRANNEEKKYFDQVSVIDVYDKSKGKYRFSFYLPNFKGLNVNDFMVVDNTLIALYQNYLYSYRIIF